MNIDEFTVEVGDEKLSCSLTSPEKARPNDESALLLNINATSPTEHFLEAGHYVLSFDLPHHGERVREYGEGILGMGKALMAGHDPFEQFIADGKAALDSCLGKGIGTNGKIVAYGVSRAGYCYLRLAAADPRVRAVAALSPVTDWEMITEFADICSKSKMKQLRIDNWSDQLADRAIYLSVGSQDDRVGVDPCVRFAMKLFDKQRRELPEGTSFNQLHVVDSLGHSPAEYWCLDGTHYLLRFCE